MTTAHKPTDPQLALAKFAGTWRGDQTLSASPWDDYSGGASAVLEMKGALDGFFVLCDYTQKRGDASYKAHLVVGFNAGSNAHQVHWFDSWGSSGTPFVGKLEGDTLIVERDGAKGRMRLAWGLKGAQLTMGLHFSTDGGKTWKAFSEGTFKKS